MQTILHILLRLCPGLRDHVISVHSAGCQSDIVDRTNQIHGCRPGIVNNRLHIVLDIIVPDSLGAVHNVDKCAGLALLAGISECTGIHGSPVLTDQPLLIDLPHPFQCFLILCRLMNRNQLSIRFHPLVPHTEPCLHNIQRTYILGHLQTVGIVLTVTVRIIVCKLIKHVIDIFHTLRGLRDSHSLRPVGPVGETVAADGTRTVHTDDLSIHGQAL